MVFNAKEHWENVYKTKKSDEVSWFQEKPEIPIKLITELDLNKESKIIDIGAGDSRLVDHLLTLGFKDITILDISSTALHRARERLKDETNKIKWVVSDLREFETDDRYDLWHDRAVLHFLTKKEDVDKYVKLAEQFLNPNGYLIISTFSKKGPDKCSGLNIKQYSEDSMKKLFSNFEHIKSFEEEHLTPFGTCQIFLFNVFRKNS